jgi:prevent-host-death family protein
MNTVSATRAQKSFGSLMRNLSRKPVIITQHGENRAVLVEINDWTDILDGRIASSVEKWGDFMSVADSESLISSLRKYA